MDTKVQNARWRRWYKCSLCEQDYHGVVRCALGWGCWKTYLGRPETDQVRSMAMTVLGNGLYAAHHNEEALSVEEANLSTVRRFGTSEEDLLAAQANIASTYQSLGMLEQSLRMKRDVYSGRLRLNGEEHSETILTASNYAVALVRLKHFEETKALMRKTIPVARRVLGDSNALTLRMRMMYAVALYRDPAATRDDLREAVAMLEDTERIARRVLGGTHPLTEGIESCLRHARAALNAREE